MRAGLRLSHAISMSSAEVNPLRKLRIVAAPPRPLIGESDVVVVSAGPTGYRRRFVVASLLACGIPGGHRSWSTLILLICGSVGAAAAGAG
jgi:hypothetical protein